MTRILQQPEIIKARYIRQYDYAYDLTADSVQLSECLRKGGQTVEADFQLVAQLMQSELEEALRWTYAILTPAWRQKLAWRQAERRLSAAEMYILDELPADAAMTATQKQKSLTFAGLFEHYKAHISRTEPDREASRIRDYAPSANRFIKSEINPYGISQRATFRRFVPCWNKLLLTAVRPSTRCHWRLRPKHRGKNLAPKPCATSSCICQSCSGSHSKTIWFQLPLFHSEPSRYGEMAHWIPTILYYTGARVEEIG